MKLHTVHPRWRTLVWNGLLAAAFLFLLADFVNQHFRVNRSESIREGIQLQEHSDRGAADPQNRILQFQVCNGFANQRLSLVYGLVLAALTNRTAVLPDMIPSGVQYTVDNIVAGASNSYSFETVYNLQYFRTRIAKTPLKILTKTEAKAQGHYRSVSLDGIADGVQLLRDAYHHEERVRLDCPLFKVPADLVMEQEDIVWTILDALTPSTTIMAQIKLALNKLTTLSPGGQFNFLHLRAERDWVAHCKRWSNIPDGVARDNCFNNTATVDDVLKTKNVDSKHPLYVATYWADIEDELSSKILARLKQAGYSVYTQKDIMPEVGSLPRETTALVEFYMGLHSNRFLGNSVSTFSAMIIFERRHAGLWASYYNGGNIPLAQVLPLDKLPWVFTYNDQASTYDYMLKAALQSALKLGGLKPYCLFSGDKNSDIYHYLVSNNVMMMQHSPAWADELVAKAKPFMQQNLRHSHLYGSAKSLVGTFQRVDIPILPELDQYDHVFFTDSDVFFTKRFTLADFGTPLPSSLGMTYEMVDMFPYNAGIMLMNLAELRGSYEKFISFMLGNQHGMYFLQYGPGDQGAYNQFYEQSVKQGKISQSFNAKPYHKINPNVNAVHFHGPKPHDYLNYAETGKCNFANLCKEGFKNSLCKYVDIWFPHIRDDPAARRLYRVCRVLELFQPIDGRAPTSFDFAAFSEA